MTCCPLPSCTCPVYDVPISPQLYLSGMPVSEDVSAAELADLTEGCSGAELRHLCNEAGLAALTEDIGAAAATRRHFLRHLDLERTGDRAETAPATRGTAQSAAVPV